MKLVANNRIKTDQDLKSILLIGLISLVIGSLTVLSLTGIELTLKAIEGTILTIGSGMVLTAFIVLLRSMVAGIKQL